MQSEKPAVFHFWGAAPRLDAAAPVVGLAADLKWRRLVPG